MTPKQVSAEKQRDRARALTLVPVSHETAARFTLLADELIRWQRVTNLVGSRTLEHLWTRHIADSAQLLGFAPKAATWLDLGSGGGFPGLVLGIMLADTPHGVIHLIEANSRKCAFLRSTARLTGARAVVHEGRIEDHMRRFPRVEAVTARALAPLTVLLDWTKDVLSTGAVGVFPKGRDLDAELTAAAKYWILDAETAPSRTDAAGRILIVRGLDPREP